MALRAHLGTDHDYVDLHTKRYYVGVLRVLAALDADSLFCRRRPIDGDVLHQRSYDRWRDRHQIESVQPGVPDHYAEHDGTDSYAGTPEFIVLYQDVPTVIQLMLIPCLRLTFVEMVAYGHLPMYRDHRLLVLYIQEDGSIAKERWAKRDATDWIAFVSALRVVHWRLLERPHRHEEFTTAATKKEDTR